MNTLPNKLRAKQIADEFSIGLSTVWLYAKIGKLTPINISPRVTVFDTVEVEKLFGGHNNGKTYHLGYFDSELEASKIYDDFVIRNKLVDRPPNHTQRTRDDCK